MGEIADMMLDGTMCEGCGEIFDDALDGEPSPGFPRHCRACRLHDDPHRPNVPASRKPVACLCGRRFATDAAMHQHFAARHPSGCFASALAPRGGPYANAKERRHAKKQRRRARDAQTASTLKDPQ